MLKGMFLLLERFHWFHDQVEQRRYPNARTLAEQFGIMDEIETIKNFQRTDDHRRY